MASKKTQSPDSMVTVKKQDMLPTVTEEEFRKNAVKFLMDANLGIQTAVLAADGKTIRTVLGLNGTRFLPDPDPDPLDDLMRMALDTPATEQGQKDQKP